MSYKRPNKKDSLNDYFTNLASFNAYAPNLIKAQDLHAFSVWFDKLRIIDRRALLLYIREHKAELKPEYVRHAQRRFRTEI